MHSTRVLALLVLAITFRIGNTADSSLKNGGATGVQQNSEQSSWWKNLINEDGTAQTEKLTEVRNLVLNNIKVEKSRTGEHLETFKVGEKALCALACGAMKECHFIQVLELGKYPLIYECTLYSEHGDTEVATKLREKGWCDNSGKKPVEQMKNWLKEHNLQNYVGKYW